MKVKRPTSEARAAASRANGSKSRGPVTDRGRYNSSQNPVRHGILSRFLVLPGEDPAQFEELFNDFMEEHQPRTPTERALVEDMVTSLWRRQRIWGLESARLQYQVKMSAGMGRSVKIDDAETLYAVAMTELSASGNSLDLFLRYETRYERQFNRALKALLNFQSRDPQPDEDDGPSNVDFDSFEVGQAPGFNEAEPAPAPPVRPPDSPTTPSASTDTDFSTTPPEVIENVTSISQGLPVQPTNPAATSPLAVASTTSTPPNPPGKDRTMAA